MQAHLHTSSSSFLLPCLGERYSPHVTSGTKLPVLHKAHSFIVLAVYVKYHEARAEKKKVL